MTFEIYILGLIVIGIFFVGCAVIRADRQLERIEKLENTVETLSNVLDMGGYGGFSRRLDVLTHEVNFANERIDNLPSEKARVVQAKVDELEKLVEELK